MLPRSPLPRLFFNHLPFHSLIYVHTHSSTYFARSGYDTMKIRFKAPSGGGTLELDDASTVDQLLESLKSSTGFADVTVKYGWPPRALTADQGQLSAQSLGLHRENLTVVPKEDASAAVAQNTPPVPEPTATTTSPAAALPGLQSSLRSQEKSKGQGIKDQNISVAMPETGSTLGKSSTMQWRISPGPLELTPRASPQSSASCPTTTAASSPPSAAPFAASAPAPTSPSPQTPCDA